MVHLSRIHNKSLQAVMRKLLTVAEGDCSLDYDGRFIILATVAEPKKVEPKKMPGTEYCDLGSSDSSMQSSFHRLAGAAKGLELFGRQTGNGQDVAQLRSADFCARIV